MGERAESFILSYQDMYIVGPSPEEDIEDQGFQTVPACS